MGVSLWGFKSPLPHHLFTRISETVGLKKVVFKGFSALSMLENLFFSGFPWFRVFRFFIGIGLLSNVLSNTSVDALILEHVFILPDS